MIEQLLELDKFLLLFINGFHADYWDSFFWLFTQKETWIPLYIGILYLIIKTKKTEATWIIVGLLLMFFLADQASSSILKPLVARLRPSHEPSLEGFVHLVNEYKGGRFGFVSSHAANSFGLALFTSILFRKKKYSFAIFLWAGINAYSRMYLGVHYPADIIGGIIIGFFAVWPSILLLKRFQPVVFKRNIYRNYSTIHFWNTEKLLLWILLISFVLLFIAAFFI